jgi:acyl-CoA synthetase (AMP-forming)/AMP-acid ligase II
MSCRAHTETILPRRYKVSQLLLVPSVVHQLINHPNIRNADLSTVQSVASGAAHLPTDLAGKLTSISSATLIQGVYLSNSVVAPKIGLFTCFHLSSGYGMSESVRVLFSIHCFVNPSFVSHRQSLPSPNQPLVPLAARVSSKVLEF